MIAVRGMIKIWGLLRLYLVNKEHFKKPDKMITPNFILLPECREYSAQRPRCGYAARASSCIPFVARPAGYRRTS